MSISKLIPGILSLFVFISCGTSTSSTKSDGGTASTDTSSSTKTTTSTSSSTKSDTSTTTDTSTSKSSSCPKFDTKAVGIWKINSDYYSIDFFDDPASTIHAGDYYMVQCFEADSTAVNSAYACFTGGNLAYMSSTVSNTYSFSDANTLVISSGKDIYTDAIKGTYTKSSLPSGWTCPKHR